MSVPRAIRQVFLAVEQSEGVGARVRRSIGTAKLRNLSPFLMLDHFSVSPGAGFPDHPHRGQETITYLLQGAFDHEDFAGHRGTIETGDLQFMTAGRGIMHAEMPRANADGSANVGLQLWVDLPETLKSVEPRYRDLKAEAIPTVDVDDGKVHVKVISGQSHGIDGVRDLAYTPVWILDITIKPGGKMQQVLPSGWNGFAYTLSGNTRFYGGNDANKNVEPFHNVVFDPKGDVVLAGVEQTATEDGHFSKFILNIIPLSFSPSPPLPRFGGGDPLLPPIIWWGVFFFFFFFKIIVYGTWIDDDDGYRVDSSHRRSTPRSEGRSVRSVCRHFSTGGLSGHVGFSNSFEWLRTCRRLA